MSKRRKAAPAAEPDVLRMCQGCSDLNGRPIYRHVSLFRVGRRDCFHCEVEEELRRAARLKGDPQAWQPGHGPKPLLDDEEMQA